MSEPNNKYAIATQLDFANRLKTARKSRGYTQKQLAQNTGVSQGLISKIEKGGQATSANNIAFSTELRINAHWLDSGIGDMDDLTRVSFDTFLTECYIYTLKNTAKYNPTVREITTIAEGIYNNGKTDGIINTDIFAAFMAFLQH